MEENMDLDLDFKEMTPEQVEAQCCALLGIRKKTPEELAAMYAEEQERKRREQEWLKEAYDDGDDEVFQRCCPACGTVFYTTNPRRIYDDYYQCSRYIHRKNARFARLLRRITICQECGKSFTPARKGARYCCDACRQKAYRKRKQLGQNDQTEQP